MRRLRWLTVLPPVGGLTVSLMALTPGVPAIAAQDAYGLPAAHVRAAAPLTESRVQAVAEPGQPLKQVDAQITAQVLARREAAKDRRQNARRAKARAAALLAAQQPAGGSSSPVSSTTISATPDCPMHALGAMGRVDEGVDYAGAGPVYAIGSGVVTLVDGASGWPGGMFIAYQLGTGGYVYLAEDVSAAVSVGQHVSPGTVIGNAYGGGSGIETGWAMPPGNIPEAAAYNHYTDGVPTQEGYDFRSVLTGMGCG